MPSRSERAPAEVKIDHNFHPLPSERAEAWRAAQPPAYFEYRRRWRENPIEHKLEDFPIHLDIEATSHCNLKCTMCPRTEMVERGAFWEVENLDYELYTRIIDEGAARGLASVKFNYLGEPLLNPRIFDMIRYAKRAGLVDVMLNTNATALTPDASRALIDAGLDQLFFSFDSPYREHYERIRIGASYHRTLRNIRRFHEIRRELGSVRPHTRIAMVRMAENEHEWQAFRELFEPIVDTVAYQDYLDHSSQTESRKMIVEQRPGERPFCCPQLWQRMFVHPDGVVTVCCVDTARELRVGNVLEQSPSEIWRGEAYERLRELHRSGRIGEIPTCAGCTLARLP
jgi:radical SAM protein with 4Fe4S-binding SPASM domain